MLVRTASDITYTQTSQIQCTGSSVATHVCYSVYATDLVNEHFGSISAEFARLHLAQYAASISFNHMHAVATWVLGVLVTVDL
jgi:hypothetical protein